MAFLEPNFPLIGLLGLKLFRMFELILFRVSSYKCVRTLFLFVHTELRVFSSVPTTKFREIC